MIKADAFLLEETLHHSFSYKQPEFVKKEMGWRDLAATLQLALLWLQCFLSRVFSHSLDSHCCSEAPEKLNTS